MSSYRFETITSARRFMELDTARLRDFINSLTDEGALLLYDRRMTLAQEKKWQKEMAGRVQEGKLAFIVCWAGKEMAGNSMARKGDFKEGHNVHFGLAVAAEHRQKGVGERLLKLSMQAARKSLKAKNLWIEYYEGNVPACALYEKLGFREVARLKNYVRHKGAYRDKILMRYSKR